MAAITKQFGSGGANMVPNVGQGKPGLADALRDIADDLAALRTAHNAVVTKLDLDGGVTDTNYAALHTVGTLLTTKA